MSEDYKKNSDDSTVKYDFLDGTADQQYLATQAFIAETDKLMDFPLMLDGTPKQQFLFMQAFIADYREKYGEIPDEDEETT